MEDLKISIVTVVFNGARYLEETINSVLNQTYKNIQYIIIDGGSTDGSVDIIKKYEDRLDYWVSEKDKGMYDGLRKGFAKVNGDVCAYINSDDFYPPTAFETVAQIFREHQNIKWLRGMGVRYSVNSSIVGAGRPFPETRNSIKKYLFGAIAQESCFWRTELNQYVDWNKFASFRLAGDHYVWYCFADHADLYVVNCWIGGHRRHPGQLSGDMNKYLNEIKTFIDKRNIFDKLWVVKWKFLYRFCNETRWKKLLGDKLLMWNIEKSKFE